MRPTSLVRTLPAADADGIALSQTTGAAADLVLAGALVTAGVAQLGAATQRRVTLTSAGNISAITFTVYGTDYRGVAISEAITGPNATTVTSVNSYATVTRIAASAAVASAVTAGTSAVGTSPVIPLDIIQDPFNVSLFLTFSGTADATVQYTGDDIQQAGVSLDSLNWFSHADLTAKTAAATGTLISPVSAIRLLNNSGTGTVTLRAIQAGVRQ